MWEENGESGGGARDPKDQIFLVKTLNRIKHDKKI